MSRVAALFMAMFALCAFGCCHAMAEEPGVPTALGQKRDLETQIAAALTRGLPIVEKAARNYPEHRNCFSCHHQTLPMLAMVAGRDRKLKVDVKLLRAQAEFSHHSFEVLQKPMKQGHGVGGRAMTVGYGLWALALADWKADSTTEAMVAYLLKTQEKDGRWTGQVARPPLEESALTATVLAVQGMKRFAVPGQRAQVEAAIAKAKGWLVVASLQNQEDRVARLLGLYLLGARPEEIRSAQAALLANQNEDGGWSQTREMKSDAYATGQTLYLLQTTGLSATDPACERGTRFLLKTQCPDGSWLVVTRSRPVQTYFDNGDPHGTNQFISIPATSWAVAALARAQ